MFFQHAFDSPQTGLEIFILFRPFGSNEVGRHRSRNCCDQSRARQHQHDRDKTACCSRWSDISIAHSSRGDYGPPQPIRESSGHGLQHVEKLSRHDTSNAVTLST